MRTRLTVFIITSTYNQLEDTKRLLSCIERQSYPDIKIYLVDDGSTDGTDQYLRMRYPEIIVLKGDGNLWWTGAIYWGVTEILKIAKKNDFILTINNDCTFGDDYIKTIVETSQRHQRAIVGSLVLDNKDKSRIIDAGVKIDWSRGRLVPLGPKRLKELPKKAEVQEEIDTLPTKGTLYPLEVFQKIGNFDKSHLPHYISDYEFACRAKRAGFLLIINYRARLYNDIARTGLGEILPQQFSLRELFDLFFARRSRINMIDHWWFITLCCPTKYKHRNYCLLVLKFFYFFSYVFPFVVFRRFYLFIKNHILEKTF